MPASSIPWDKQPVGQNPLNIIDYLFQKEATGALTHAGAHLDLSAFSSYEELASLGLDRLKSALMALGLKCGGTLQERAQRLFSTKGKSLEDLDPAMFAKSKPGKAGRNK